MDYQFGFSEVYVSSGHVQVRVATSPWGREQWATNGLLTFTAEEWATLRAALKSIGNGVEVKALRREVAA